jgi:hypothetical protein
MRWLTLLLLVASCGGPTTTANEGDQVPDDRPRLDGALVLDVSLESAPEEARDVWQVAQRLLEDRGPQPPADLSIDDYMDWMRAVFAPWLEGRVAVMRDLRDKFQALADAGPRERIFSAVVAAYLYQDFARLIEALPVPVEVESDREMRAAFAAQLRSQAAPAWARAREAWSRCVDWAPEAPEALEPWGDACAARLAELPDIEEPEPAPRRIAWPEECTRAPEGARPDALDQGPTARRPVALLVGDRGPLTLDERDRVADAVFRFIRRTQRGIRLLPLREVRRAREAAAAGRAVRNTTCARAPTTIDLLRSRHEDLVAGAVSADCYYVDDEHVCSLDVHLGKKDDGSPLALGVRLDEPSFDVDDFIAAVDQLDEDGATAAILGVVGAGSVAGAVQIRFVTPYGEWGDVDVRRALAPAESPLGECRDAGNVPPVDMHVVLEVAPDGAVSDIAIDPAPYGEARSDCVVNALEDVTLPAASGERRITFTLAFYPESPVAIPYRAVERVPHAGALGVGRALADRFLRDAVSRCYAAVPVAEGAVASYHASFEVNPDGSVANVDLEGVSIPDGVGEEINACISTALSGARFACTPDREAGTVEATICLGVR